MASIFCRRPDLAYRYEKQMYSALAQTIFADDNKEIMFYASCLALYRFNLLSSNADIPQDLKKYKWHIITIVCALIAGKLVPEFNSKQMETYCNKLVQVLSKTNTDTKRYFKEAIIIVNSVQDITDDRLKRQTVLEEMMSYVE